VHALNGSLRLRVSDAVRSPDRFGLAEALLRTIPGVSVVAADVRTGSISIAYEPSPARRETPPAARDVEVLPGELVPCPPRSLALVRPAAAPGWAAWIGRTIAVIALEVVLQRVLGPLFPRRC
jgi:hypothetical protein